MRADQARAEMLFAKYGRWLSPDERQRLDGHHHAETWATMTIGRLLLRRCLTAAMGKSEADHDLVVGPTGKPQLRDGDVEFNVSHAKDLVAVAIAPHPVGIDLESIDELPSAIAAASPLYLMEPALSPAETTMLLTLPDRARRRRLVGLWTRKEALVKCDGQGLGINPATICLVTGVRPLALSALHLASLDLAQGFTLTLAQPRETSSARMRLLDDLPPPAALVAAGWTALGDKAFRSDAYSRPKADVRKLRKSCSIMG